MYIPMIIALLLALQLISILAQFLLSDHGALHRRDQSRFQRGRGAVLRARACNPIAGRRVGERPVRRGGARYWLPCLTAMVTLSDSGSNMILASPFLS